MADKPGENKPGEKVTHSDHGSVEKDGSPDIQKARNPNADEVTKATMNSLKLYRGADVVGIVTDPEQEGPQTTAGLELTPAAADHQEVIDYILSKKEPGQDPPESLNLWEDWFIEDENGEKKAIHPPAIYPGAKFVSWRWKRTKTN